MTTVTITSSATALSAKTDTAPTLHLSPSSLFPSSSSSTSHLGLRPPMPPPLTIPGIGSLNQTSPVPFPRISQRRKLYRGVGTQPWHLKVSDSDSESDESPVTKRSKQHRLQSSTPNPEAMSNFDPKRTYSESQIPSSSLSALTTTAFTPMIRKKSGEIVKSALKSPSQSSFGESSSSRIISRPSTPTFDRSVRFDQQLEYVKLFKHQQKPAAVSHEGSPCDTETSDNDTFGQQSDGLYRSSEDERIRAGLVMESVNIPLRNAMASTQERLGDIDIRLDQVVLSSDGRAVEGTILVRNIAYEKWVAVRFTYDRWQTTSEVTAKYSKSFPEENTDLFSFTIRLPEVTKRLEEKTLSFALRYTAAGRECWDNNRGENYHLRFKTETKRRRLETGSNNPKSSSVRPPSWPMHSNQDDQMAELRKELEKVVREEEESNGGVHAWDLLTVKLRARNMDIEEDREAKKTSNFHGRYDFKTSSKVKWEPPQDIPRYSGSTTPETAGAIALPAEPRHTRSVSANAAAPSSIGTGTETTPPPLQLHQASWRSPRGSPRDHGTDSTASSPKFFIDPREAKHWKAPIAGSGRVRNHQRGGYFDSYMEGLSKTILTPPTSTSTPRVEEEDALIVIDVTDAASASHDSAITVTATTTTTTDKRKGDLDLSDVSNVVAAPEDAAEMSSETESTSSSTTTSSSHVTNLTLPSSIAEATRAIRFNSYPMDRTHFAVTNSSPSPLPEGGSSSANRPALLTVPQQTGWPLSPQGSSSSVVSTPSITSASSPSQCPSSPAELSDSMPSIHYQLALGGGAQKPGVDSLDYNLLLQKFCYFTGNNLSDRHGQNSSYGSIHHRHSQSESPSWDVTRVVDADSGLSLPLPLRRRSLDTSPASYTESRASVAAISNTADYEANVVMNDDVWPADSRYGGQQQTMTEVDRGTWSSESGHTTPTLSPKMQLQHGTFSPYGSGSPGKRTPTPRAGAVSPENLEGTPRLPPSSEYFVRPYRESL